LKEMALFKDLMVIDFAEGLNQEHYLADRVHPNEFGHQLMFENVLSCLSRGGINRD